MATIINDMTLEPKASPPSDETKGSSSGSQSAAPGPELERQVQQIERRRHERGLRLWAY
jgi:hypothetical protein